MDLICRKKVEIERIYCGLSRWCTARGFIIGWLPVGPAKVKASKSILFTEGFPKVESCKAIEWKTGALTNQATTTGGCYGYEGYCFKVMITADVKLKKKWEKNSKGQSRIINFKKGGGVCCTGNFKEWLQQSTQATTCFSCQINKFWVEQL